MLLLRANHLLGGSLAHRLGEALPRQTVPCRQQSVVDGLSSHVNIHLGFALRSLKTAQKTHCTSLAQFHCFFPNAHTLGCGMHRVLN